MSKLSDFGTDIPKKSDALEVRAPKSFGATAEPRESTCDTGEPSLTQWSLFGPKQFLGSATTIRQLKPGLYRIPGEYQGQPIFEKQDIKVDDLIVFSDDLSSRIFKEIDDFWARGKKFVEHGFLHRRGYLFYGPQGSGKTAMSQQIIKNVVEGGDIVFSCDRPNLLQDALSVFRQVEPERRILCLFEDIDAIISTWGESSILGLLDGENQIDKVLNIATTNYPERLDKRIVSRPRRFDRVLKIDMPSVSIRREYLSQKLKIKGEDLDKWVSATEGFSFASLAEMVISVKCLGNTFEETLKTLRGMMTQKVSSEDFEDASIGFNGRK